MAARYAVCAGALLALLLVTCPATRADLPGPHPRQAQPPMWVPLPPPAVVGTARVPLSIHAPTQTPVTRLALPRQLIRDFGGNSVGAGNSAPGGLALPQSWIVGLSLTLAGAALLLRLAGTRRRVWVWRMAVVLPCLCGISCLHHEQRSIEVVDVRHLPVLVRSGNGELSGQTVLDVAEDGGVCLTIDAALLRQLANPS